MNALNIEGTQYTPRINFSLDGQLLISGKSLPEDTATFYEPVLKWIHEFHSEKISIAFRLHYMNSSSANQISKLMMVTKENPAIKECTVEWYYEPEDEDMLEFGRELEYATDFNFKFYEYA